MKTYQAHDGSAEAISNTQRKLARLHLPAELKGKRVLDIGCNEGYFTHLAHERGAVESIGIDFVASNIEFAIKHYGREGVSYLRQGWSNLPEGPFDLILWTSAMHYELDPRSITDLIFDRLSPDGLFVLECGVLMTPGKEFVPVPRIADTRWYPSREFLVHEVLAKMSVRQVAEPEVAVGDFVPRAVFHCRKALPMVVLVRGASGTGKTTAAEHLRGSSTKLVNLDLLVSKMGTNHHPHDELERFVIAQYDPTNLGKIYSGIDDAGLTEAYADLLCKAVARTDKLVTIEGYITDLQAAAIARRLKDRAILWTMQRSDAAVT